MYDYFAFTFLVIKNGVSSKGSILDDLGAKIESSVV